MSSETGSKDTIALRDAAVVGPMHKLGKIDTTIPVYPPDGTPQAGARVPDFVEPMKATLVDSVRPGSWIYEIKFDGYRALGLRGGGRPGFARCNGFAAGRSLDRGEHYKGNKEMSESEVTCFEQGGVRKGTC